MPGKINLKDATKAPFPIRLEPANQHGVWLPEAIVPNFHPTLLNKLMVMYYKRRNEVKLSEMVLIANYCKTAGLTAALGKRMVKLTFEFPKGQRRGDADGYLKTVLDALVKCGALVNDSGVWCEWTMPSLIRGEKRETRIQLFDIT